MQWYNVQEKSAGKYRLLFSLWIYKIFGKFSLKAIAFFVALITYITNKDIRGYSKKYFRVLFNYTKDEKLHPNNFNSFCHVLSYALSLADKMEVFLDKFNHEDVDFVNLAQKEILLKDINQKGTFFICNHVGNIDVMRALFLSKKYTLKSDVSVFLQKNHCKIFNEFINNLNVNDKKIKIYPIEEIDLSSANILDDSLKNGGVVFMAGDRVAINNKNKVLECSFLDNKINLPIGVFRFAKLMNSNIYFISCVKEKNKYKVYLEKFLNQDINSMQEKYIEFFKKMTLLYPYQFYHFYDIFKE